MFQLDQDGVSKTRTGYLFAYAQIAFNQFRRYANLQLAEVDHRQHMERIRARIASGDVPSAEECTPRGWRSFAAEWEIQAEQLECKILAVLSTTLFLEAYIYDYCARIESANFVSKYLDKLDPVAKWVVIPRLIVPPGLDSGNEVFERLREVFRLRNELVHHKTKEGADFELPPEFPANWHPQDCVKLICDLLSLLQAADPRDEFGAFVLRHVGSWLRYTARDSTFYPILWEA